MLTWVLWGGLAWAGDVEPVLVSELDRATAAWTKAGEVPHYVAIAVDDVESHKIVAREGALVNDHLEHDRWLDVDLRLGTPELDSTHDLRGMSGLANDTRSHVPLAFEGASVDAAIHNAVWRELDARWRAAKERIVLLRADQAVRVAEEDPAPDFEPRTGVLAHQPPPPMSIESAVWQPILVDLSSVLASGTHVVVSEVSVEGRRSETTRVDSEGSRLVYGTVLVRVALSATIVADDGDRLVLYRSQDVHDPASLPDAAALTTLARSLVADAEALRAAPRATPYTGPVLLLGRATGVFVHEVMGHRVEGQRNKDEEEGKTFLSYLGQRVLPVGVDIVDDPTVAHLAGEDLNGFYPFDDEGVPAQRAELVHDGIFRGFLMSRSPLAAFPHSNGHGRRSTGNSPAARMGNTIVSSTAGKDLPTLRRLLLAEAKAQGLPFAYIVEEIDGGFTLTGREMPNAFNVRASRTRRVWADGRPDELVRGLDLVGTPLAAFQNVVAVGDTQQVFNGYCGAESGWVPVSAVAPAMLFRRLEFQIKEKESARPPLLPRPDADRNNGRRS